MRGWATCREIIPGRGNSMCKVPEVGAHRFVLAFCPPHILFLSCPSLSNCTSFKTSVSTSFIESSPFSIWSLPTPNSWRVFLVWTISVTYRIGCLLNLIVLSIYVCVCMYVRTYMYNLSISSWRAGVMCPEKAYREQGLNMFLDGNAAFKLWGYGVSPTFRIMVELRFNN